MNVCTHSGGAKECGLYRWYRWCHR